VANSFKALQPVLEVGQEVSVNEGIVDSCRRVDLAFTEDLVTSIRIEDSVWTGAILGAVPLAASIEIACSLRNCHRGNLWGLATTFTCSQQGHSVPLLTGS
jgi:hypothetical protein